MGNGSRPTAEVRRETVRLALTKGRTRREIAEDPVAQDFMADDPDRKWGADISYIWTAKGWLYLAAPRHGLSDQWRSHGAIHHCGRGTYYDNAMVLRRENSARDCFLILLTVFKTIKPDQIWPVAWQTRALAENAFARYINGF